MSYKIEVYLPETSKDLFLIPKCQPLLEDLQQLRRGSQGPGCGKGANRLHT